MAMRVYPSLYLITIYFIQGSMVLAFTMTHDFLERQENDIDISLCNAYSEQDIVV